MVDGAVTNLTNSANEALMIRGPFVRFAEFVAASWSPRNGQAPLFAG